MMKYKNVINPQLKCIIEEEKKRSENEIVAEAISLAEIKTE